MACLHKNCSLFYKFAKKNIINTLKCEGRINSGQIFPCFILEKRCYTWQNKDVLRSPFPDITIPNKTFAQLIWERHENWKYQTAVECGITGDSYTYLELIKRSERIGKGLLNEGLRPKDVVAFLLTNRPDYIAAILGVSHAGFTICSINPAYTPDEIAHHINNSGAKCIITFPEKLQETIVAVEKVIASGRGVDNIKIISTKCLDGKDISLPKQVKSLEEIIDNGISERKVYSLKDLNSDLAFISHSSGTTGLPKGVALTHKNITASILQMASEPMTCFQETTSYHQDVVPIVLPLFHNFALEIALDLLYHGSKVVTLPKFEGQSFLSTLRNHKATMVFAVPPLMLFLSSEAKREDLNNLRCICCAAAPIGEEDILRTLSKAPPNVHFVQAYGQTEATCCLTHTPYGVKDYQSVGVAVVNTILKVIDIENGSSKPPFEEGEICFQGPQMSPGYINNPQATRESIDNNGWFHTGDIGYYDKEGCIYIVDRIKEMIKVKGFQVAPAELEAVLRNHPAVEDAGVTSIPDDRKGEAPVGFIKVKSNANVTEKELKHFLSEKVAPFKMIDRFYFIDSIPKNPSGKILRRELKRLLKT